jgi:hypothetical protein
LEQRGGRLARERRKATGRSVAPFSQNVEGREGVGVRLAWPSGGEDERGSVARASEEGGSSDRQWCATDGGGGWSSDAA